MQPTDRGRHRQRDEKKAGPTSVPTDPSSELSADPMNLDDFLVPNSIASPAGMTPFPGEHARAAAMPMQSRKGPRQPSTEPPPLSAVAPPSTAPNRSGDVDSGERRVRKTSSDEGRVRRTPSPPPRSATNVCQTASKTAGRVLASRAADNALEPSWPGCRHGQRDA
jgi:hypothetical protein